MGSSAEQPQQKSLCLGAVRQRESKRCLLRALERFTSDNMETRLIQMTVKLLLQMDGSVCRH